MTELERLLAQDDSCLVSIASVKRALKQEPATKNDLAVDIDKLIADCEKMSFDIDFFNKPLKVVALDAVKNIVKELPSITPIRPKGHWIKHNIPNNTYYYDCSLCGCAAPCTETADSYLWKLSNFCPDCGADMREVEE